MECLIETPFDGPWRRFERPLRVLRAERPSDVAGVLRDADAALADGCYVAGYLAYEAAAAFGLPARSVSGPLAALAVYSPSSVRTVAAPGAPARCEDVLEWQSSLTREDYRAALQEIKARIAAGDTYQINFTFRLRARFAGDPRALFQRLLQGQRGGWAAFVSDGPRTILSASPELLYRCDGDTVECRPMKGTAPRGRDLAEDLLRAGDLRMSEKNRAENVMVVDMTRNDLGAIAEVGSVRAASLFDVERYPRQWQMTSRVTATVPPAGLSRLLPALFPSGSVTGAPKHRSMQIVDTLERDPRGVYTGAVGYAAPDGRSHFNVAIRTVTLDGDGRAEFGVGSGIVWDSDPDEEYEECLVKASMLAAADPPFSLLETFLWEPGSGARRARRHLARMRDSAEYFGRPFDRAAAEGAIAAAVRDASGASRVRLLLHADGGFECASTPYVAKPGPWRVALAGERVDRRDARLFHKTTDRRRYDRARAARPDVDTLLLLNADDEVTEALEANLVIEEGGRRLTPALDCGLLPGVLRAELLDAGEIAEARITRARLLAAPRAWLINSLRGWIPVTIVP